MKKQKLVRIEVRPVERFLVPNWTTETRWVLHFDGIPSNVAWHRRCDCIQSGKRLQEALRIERRRASTLRVRRLDGKFAGYERTWPRSADPRRSKG